MFYDRQEARRRIEAAARRRTRIAKTVCGIVATLAVLGLVVLGVSSYLGSTRDVTVTITNEANVCRSSGNGVQSCQYLIYTSGGTFSDSDSLLSGKFNSSDVYGQLQIGHTYTLKVRGYRIPFLSDYPNIIAVIGPVK